MRPAVAAFLALLAATAPARAAVVINEVLYHAPDDLDRLQYIELHNAGDKAVALGGWKLARGVKYAFPAKASIPAGGYLAVSFRLSDSKRLFIRADVEYARLESSMNAGEVFAVLSVLLSFGA